MADAASPNTTILEWAGTKLGGSTLSAVSTLAAQHLLQEMGLAPDGTAPIAAALERISAQLDQLNRAVATVDQHVTALAEQLKVATLDEKREAELRNLRTVISFIKTHYAGAGSASTNPSATRRPPAASGTVSTSAIISLRDLVTRQGAGPVPTALVTQFMNDLLVEWDIPSKVDLIRDSLVGELGQGGLLRAWTDLYVAKMGLGARDRNLLSYYDTLEQWFVHAVTVQLQAVHLVMLAKCYGSPTNTVPADAAQYLWEDFAGGVLQSEIDLFLSCAERLALSQGQWRSSWPTLEETMAPDATGKGRWFMGIGVPADLGTILFRSAYLCRRFTEAIRDERTVARHSILGRVSPFRRSLGWYAHVIGRGAGLDRRDLTLWPGDEEAAGKFSGHTTFYESRVLETKTGVPAVTWSRPLQGYPRILRREFSDLWVARYFRNVIASDIGANPGARQSFAPDQGWSRFTVPQETLTSMGVESEMVPWFRPQNRTAEPDVVLAIQPLIAHGLDLTNLVASPDPGKLTTGWTIGPLDYDDDYSKATFESRGLDRPLAVPRADEPRAYVSLRCTQKKQPNRTRSADIRLECPLFGYIPMPEVGPDSLTMYLRISIGTMRSRTQRAGFNMGSRAILKLVTPDGESLLYDSDTANDGRLALWSVGEKTAWGNLGDDLKKLPVPGLSSRLDQAQSDWPQASDQWAVTKTLEVGKTGLGWKTPEPGKPMPPMEKYRLILELGIAHRGDQPGATGDIYVNFEDCTFTWSPAP